MASGTRASRAWRGGGFVDSNGNGSRDEGEPAATTDENGNYTISGLPAGNYTVRHQLQPGWQQTLPVAGVQPLTNTNESEDGKAYRTDGVNVAWSGFGGQATTQVDAYAAADKGGHNPDVTSNADPRWITARSCGRILHAARLLL